MPADLNSPLVLQGALCEQYGIAAADGAVTQRSGTVFITKATAAALTIANPVAGDPAAGGDDGKRLTVISTTAAAHTLTRATTGFNDGSTGADVGTFGGAKGDNIAIVAYAGRWYIESKVNVTVA